MLSSSQSLQRQKNEQILLIPTIAIGATIAAYFIASWKQKRSCGRSKSSLSSDFEESSLLLTEDSITTSSSTTDDDECIYLDYNGTTPIHRIVLAAMIPFLTVHYGNPSSSHFYGHQPKIALDQARKSLLKLIGKNNNNESPSSIWFTGCGTESDNLAIELALRSYPTKEKTTKHIVTTNVEHPAIMECLRSLENNKNNNIEVTYVPVESDGRVLAKNVIDAIRDDDSTVLVTIMLANNESGALQPVSEIASVCRQRNILFHTDAAQACGKVDVAKLVGDSDMITIVGHKIGAPKGVAALYVRDGCCNEKGRELPSGGIMLLGGGQEGGRRGGTENVPYCVGLGKAAELAIANLRPNMEHMESMRTRLYQQLRQKIPSEIPMRINGPIKPEHRLPNTLSVGIAGIQSGSLLREIGNEVAASAGAACHSSNGCGSISSVLKAMQVPKQFAEGTLRLSLGPSITSKEIDKAASIIAERVKSQLL